MNLLLSEPLPLRTSAQLGNFAAQFVLAHRYGDLTSGRFAIDRMNDTTFFVADHPMTVTDVFVDGQKTSSWAQRTQTDASGHTWTVGELAAPAPSDAVLSACGTGKRNPRTGALIENPADIVEDLFRIAGRDPIPLDQLRAECAAAGIRLAGSVDSVLSIRATIDAMLGSAGAVWTPRMARLYPTQTVTGFIRALDQQRAWLTGDPEGNLNNCADILRIYYDPDAASDSAQHFIELTASPMRFGGLAVSLTLPWLRTPNNAESVGRRLLAWMAGKRVTVPFNTNDGAIRGGDWTVLDGLRDWPLPNDFGATVMVLSAAVTPGQAEVECSGETLVSAPNISVTAYSAALPTTTEPGVDVFVKGNSATLVIRDAQSQPVVDAQVALDGGEPKKTDPSGSVTFFVTRDPKKKTEHRLAVKASGKQATLQSVWL